MGKRHAIGSNRILTPEGFIAGNLIINGSRIEAIVPKGKLPTDLTQTDVGNLVVMPGVIDPHVHINEPGRTDWEGFETATKSAAAGGTTTLVDMPLNSSPVTTNFSAFQEKIAAAKGQTYVNCGFWGGFVPGSETGLIELLSSGVLGFKVFLTDSGLDEFQAVDKKSLLKAMEIMSGHGLPLLAHAELASPLPYPDPFIHNIHSYQAHLKSRPAAWELQAIDLLIALCAQTGTATHVVHLATADAIDSLKKARKNLPITVETCPHYLYFSSDEIPDNRPEFKCAPPIRNKDNNLQLWKALENGHIDFVATDHSPAPAALKCLNTGNLQKAWGGISSLQFLLPAIWTKCRQQGRSFDFLVKILCENAATFIGQSRKGKILSGYDADLVIWDPEASFTVKKEAIHYKHKISPYIGESLLGVVHMTYVNGELVYHQGEFSPAPSGNILLKS